MHTRVIAFDLDDTLYPESEYVLSGLRAAGDLAARTFGLQSLAAEAIALYESGQRGTLFQQVLRRRGLPETEAVINALVVAYRSHRPEIRLFPDVAEALPSLARLCRLAVITDGYLPPQELKVAALGVAALCDPVIYTERLGRQHWKPSPVPFMVLERACRVEPARCIYVADNPRKDFVAPRSRGWTTVRIRRPGTEHADVEAQQGHHPHVELPDFGALARYLASLPA